MCFISHYDQDISSLRLTATEKLATSGGGRNQIIEVDSIVIETNCIVTAWDKLLPPEQVYSPRLNIKTGVTSRIQEVVIKTKCSVPISSMCFGDAVFSFQSCGAV